LKRFQRVNACGGGPPEKNNGLKHRETTKNTTGKQGKSVLFTEHYVRSLKQTRTVPIQTLVNRIFVTQHRSKARVWFAYVHLH